MSTRDKPKVLTRRRKAWCAEFGCGPTYSHKLEKEGVIKTVKVGKKMTLIITSPEEALATLAAREQARIAQHAEAD
jgi:hypothetical protein